MSSFNEAIQVLLLIRRYKDEHKVCPSQEALSKEYGLPWFLVGSALSDLLSHGWIRSLPKYRRWTLTREGRIAADVVRNGNNRFSRVLGRPSQNTKEVR